MYAQCGFSRRYAIPTVENVRAHLQQQRYNGDDEGGAGGDDESDLTSSESTMESSESDDDSESEPDDNVPVPVLAPSSLFQRASMIPFSSLASLLLAHAAAPPFLGSAVVDSSVGSGADNSRLSPHATILEEANIIEAIHIPEVAVTTEAEDIIAPPTTSSSSSSARYAA
jgi:hypothetical protein